MKFEYFKDNHLFYNSSAFPKQTSIFYHLSSSTKKGGNKKSCDFFPGSSWESQAKPVACRVKDPSSYPMFVDSKSFVLGEAARFYGRRTKTNVKGR